MNRFEMLSQTKTGECREVDGQSQYPLEITGIALTTPFSHEHYPLPLFSLSGAVTRSQPNLHGIKLARALVSDGIIDSITAKKTDVLALSAPQGTLETLDQTLTRFRQLAPEKRPHIILGGSLPTYLSDRFFKKYPDLSMTIVAGWGEESFAEEVKSCSTQGIKPQQKIISGKTPEDYPKQDCIPQKGEVIFHYPRVEASKGCFWGACSYCLRPWSEEQGKWKQYRSEDVLTQVSDLLKLGYTGYFEFADEEVVGTNSDNFRQIIDGLIEIKRDYPSMTFGMNMRADHIISPEPEKQDQYDSFLLKAKKAGLSMVWMGAESYSSSHLQILHKGQRVTPEVNLEAAKKLDELGIGVLQGFLPYHPLSKWEELTEMVDFMEPHTNFLSKVLGSPFGFLRVQYTTSYLETVQKFESDTNRRLIGKLDEDLLTYHCKYQDASIGLNAVYMRLVYDWINPQLKQISVEALKGSRENKDKLDNLRLAGLKLFIRSIKQLEPLQDDLLELQKRQLKILDEYKKEVGIIGVDVPALNDFMQRNFEEYLSSFM